MAKEFLEQELEALRIDPEKRTAREPVSPRLKRALYISGALAAILLLALLVGKLRAPAAIVEVARAELSGPSAEAALIASGYVVAHHRIEVGSKVMGKVAWVGVEKGDQVKAGQIVVRLEDEEYRARVEEARAAVALADARVREYEAGARPEEVQRVWAERENARVNLERVKRLVAEGVYSPQQLDDAQTRFEVAEKSYELQRTWPRPEQMEQVRAELERVRAALAFAETQLEATRIRAPRDGTILERLVESGEMVTTMFAGERGATSFVVSLADLADIQVELDINQNDFNRVFLKQPAEVALESYPDRRYRGEVVEIAPEANRQKGTVQIKVQFLQPDERVRPELIARVTLERPARPGVSAAPVVSIPRQARVERAGQAIVFVVEDGRARAQAVRAQESAGDRLIVLEGLKGGETIVIAGHETLEDGMRVEVKPTR